MKIMDIKSTTTINLKKKKNITESQNQLKKNLNGQQITLR